MCTPVVILFCKAEWDSVRRLSIASQSSQEKNTNQHKQIQVNWATEKTKHSTVQSTVTGNGNTNKRNSTKQRVKKMLHTCIGSTKYKQQHNYCSRMYGVLNNECVLWRSLLFIVSILLVNRYSHFIMNIWSLAMCECVCARYVRLFVLHKKVSLNQISVPLLECTILSLFHLVPLAAQTSCQIGSIQNAT